VLSFGRLNRASEKWGASVVNSNTEDSIEKLRLQSEDKHKEIELELRRRELDIKSREVELKSRSDQKALWASPISLAIFGVFVTLLGNLFISYNNSITEQIKSRSSLIIEAIKTGDPAKARANITLLAEGGLFGDEILQKRILENLQNNPQIGLPNVAASAATARAAPVFQVSPPPLSPSPLGIAAIEIAMREVGVREVPPGSNSGPRVNEYLQSVGLGRGFQWSAAFIYWSFQKASEKLQIANPMPKGGASLSILSNIKSPKSFLYASAAQDGTSVKPSIGDVSVVSFGDGAYQLGIVSSVKNENEVEVIEGNTNDAGSDNGIGVFLRVRRISDIDYFARFEN
jgi:hypothetical protein